MKIHHLGMDSKDPGWLGLVALRLLDSQTRFEVEL